MPTVLRLQGFRVSILFPPREHPPPHVHVRSATGAVIIQLAHADRPQIVRRAYGMSRADMARAEKIVAEHGQLLLEEWRRIWGG
jgi:hypothetical protein